MILKLAQRIRQVKAGGRLEIDTGHAYQLVSSTSSKACTAVLFSGLLRTAEDTRELIAQYLDGWDKTVAGKVREIEFTFEDVK